VDLTTSSPESARELAAAAAELGLVAFDCPVTGGQAGAEAGTLSGFVGATREVAAPALPVLDVLCEHLFFFDTAGAGQVTKLCNQLSLAGCMLGMADALAFAREHGLDEDAVIAALATGMGSSRALTELGPKAAAGDFKPGFMAKDLRKDIALALLEANEQQLTLPGAQTAWTLYDTLCAIGGERLATQAITVLYQDEAEAVAAGLDWSRLDAEELLEREEAVAGYGHHGDACSCDDDDCGCGHDHVHESADACGCGHDHGEHHHHGHHRAH
jgi:3-hydroxyisobutyrate dehydrogenase